MMNFEEKIKKELDKHDQQWEDAVRPSVIKYGKQADKKIEKLKEEIGALLALNKNLSTELLKVRAMLEDCIAAYCGHYSDIPYQEALHRTLLVVEKYLEG